MFDVLDEFVALTKTFTVAKIDYAVCGGLSVMIHGFVRATEDIDILVEAESLARVVKVAANCGFRLHAEELVLKGAKIFRLLKLSPDSEDYLVLDLILVSDANRAAWDSRHEVSTQWGTLKTVSREALIEMKRQAGRPQDLVDIQRMEGADEGN